MTQDEQICSLALTRIPGLGPTGAFRLVSSLGSATRVFEHRKELSQLVPGVSEKIITALNNSEAFRRAEQELTFCEKNHIRCLTLNDEGYPGRLRECDDAPLALFYRGNADLNALHVINMVGTRHATPYGQDICTRFLADLSVLCPNALIVSGLAYGIDIHAHRAALQNHFKTIGVLAHGLDRIYPAEHRKTAVSMLEQGGLLTEFTSGTNPDRQNFVKRNRIVAGMSDATVVIESAAKGGSPHHRRTGGKLSPGLFCLSGTMQRRIFHRLQQSDKKKPGSAYHIGRRFSEGHGMGKQPQNRENSTTGIVP